MQPPKTMSKICARARSPLPLLPARLYSINHACRPIVSYVHLSRHAPLHSCPTPFTNNAFAIHGNPEASHRPCPHGNVSGSKPPQLRRWCRRKRRYHKGRRFLRQGPLPTFPPYGSRHHKIQPMSDVYYVIACKLSVPPPD